MLIPVILSGGAGTRLWPLSREAHPKPFIRLPDGQSLLHRTFARAAALPNVTDILTVTNRDYYFKTKDECLAGVHEATPSFLLEPCGRNTAPAVALAALQLSALHGSHVTLLVLPADHLIRNEDAFKTAVSSAAALAEQGRLVTFGIRPTAPETGFGYIEAGDAIGAGYVARRFVEKPNIQLAQEYVAAGNFYWNSGMFCFRADALLSAMEAISPDVIDAARACWSVTRSEGELPAAMIELDAATFKAQPDISIDYAVMEKADNVAVIPCDMGWSDIGSWSAVGDLLPADQEGNRSLGDAVLVDTRNTFVQSEHHLVAAVGVQDLIIIDSQDAVLVAHKDKAQDVRKVVARLKSIDHEACKFHRTVSRPWGAFTILEEGPRFKIKRIEVKPGASLSLQMHHHRSEHWVVVSGTAKVVVGDQETFVKTNESTYIPAGTKHRLSNPGLIDCVMIEVQTGDYVGEDDIVRFEDQYGR